MTLKEILSNSATRKSAGTGLLLIIVAALTLEATSLIQFYFTQKGLRQEATQRAESELDATKNEIMDVINQAEAAVRNNVWITRWCLDIPDSLHRVTELLVKNNPIVVGSTVALLPGYNQKHPLYAPYTFRSGGELLRKTLATEFYDYPTQEWFQEALKNPDGYWSEPYIDKGGGDILMTTFSLPVKDKKGEIAAVVTADISLNWLTEVVGDIKVYPKAFSMVLSRAGRIVVCPEESLVMKKTAAEVARTLDDTTTAIAISRAMLEGRDGNMQIKEKGTVNEVFFSPVEKTGWALSIIIPESDIYGKSRRIGFLVGFLQLLGIIMLIVIIRSSGKNQLEYQKLSRQREKMEGELRIASNIQMSMIPKSFPPFPDREDIDLAAKLEPAKEVGGDLYDYFIRDDELFFCIGDVSGKGVPASLVMATTRSLFHSVASREHSPAKIVASINSNLCEMNENTMFVTFFCGVFDLKTGRMVYCNAGHNAPMVLREDIQMLDVEANLPMGVLEDFVFKEQEIHLQYDDALFLYTDGLTEAENIQHELFGEERAQAVLHRRRGSYEHLKAMLKAVSEFVGEAPQSDDLTMLFLHYLGHQDPGKDKHLILHNDIQQIPQLAEFVETIAREKSLEQSLAMSLNLALEEAVTNVILYAYPEGSDGLVEIEAILKEKRLDFIISDSGVAFDPTQKPDTDITLGVQERRIGGLGILMVKTIMDKVEYRRENGKNILSMTKHI